MLGIREPGWWIALNRSPLLANRAGTRLSDVQPSGDVHLFEIELEQRIVRNRLEHPAHVASCNHLSEELSGRFVRYLRRDRTDAHLVVLGAG